MHDSGILMLSISVIYVTIGMHLNITINTSMSMRSDLKVCRLTKKEFKYMFLIIWRPQQFLVVFFKWTLSPFFSFEVFMGKTICSIHVQIWWFRILWKKKTKRCSDVWIVLIKWRSLQERWCMLVRAYSGSQGLVFFLQKCISYTSFILSHIRFIHTALFHVLFLLILIW